MGNKSTRSSSVNPEKPISSEAFIYYLNRSEGVVFLLKDMKIDKKSFAKVQIFSKDSGMGYLTEFSLMIAGGTSNNNTLTKKCRIIDMDQMFIRNISPLPIKAKQGSLHAFRSFVYYTGGLRQNDDPSIGNSTISLPLMRYKVFENTWEVFNGESYITTFSYSNLLYGFNIDTLIDPGNFIFNNKIYYFAGGYLNGQHNLDVFSLDLIQDAKFVKEHYEFSNALFSPICGYSSCNVFICGGKDIQGYNKKCFGFNGKFYEIIGKELEITENHPLKHTEKYTVLPAFPKFALKTYDAPDWTIYNLTGSNYMVSTLTAALKGSASRKNLPPITPRSRKVQIGPESDKSNKYGRKSNTHNETSTLHLTFFPVSGEEKKRMNSPEKYEAGEPEKVLLSDQEIIDKENDFLFKVKKKIGVKFICLILINLDKAQLSTLENNQIWQNFGLVSVISIGEIACYLDDKLKKLQYKHHKIKKIIKITYRNCQNPQVRSKRIKEILKNLQLPDKIVYLSKESAVYILTRILKAISANR